MQENALINTNYLSCHVIFTSFMKGSASLLSIIICMRCKMNKDDVVLRISQARNKAGLSARDLSLKIDKNEAYISRLESKKGSFEPSVSALLNIISACGMSECEFFYYDLNQYDKDKQLIELLRKVKPEIKDLMIALLKKI